MLELSPKLILMIGLPGSGKSTLAQLFVQQFNYRLISTDRIRFELFGDEAIQGDWLKIQRERDRQIQQAFQDIAARQITAVIYDATNARRRHRRAFLQQTRSIGFTHVTGIWLDTPLEVCLARNLQRDRQVPESVIGQMHRQLVGAPPSLGEGLDCLMRWS